MAKKQITIVLEIETKVTDNSTIDDFYYKLLDNKYVSKLDISISDVNP